MIRTIYVVEVLCNMGDGPWELWTSRPSRYEANHSARLALDAGFLPKRVRIVPFDRRQKGKAKQ
jgi:hypothetical protein